MRKLFRRLCAAAISFAMIMALILADSPTKAADDDFVVFANEDGIDLSGVKPLYGTGSVSYDSATNTATGTDVNGLLVPLGVTIPIGVTVSVTISGTASAGMRAWLSDSGEKRFSDTVNINFDTKFSMTATANADGTEANHMQIKGSTYDVIFSTITITKIVIEFDPSVVISTPTPAPTRRPTPTMLPKFNQTPVPEATDVPAATAVPDKPANPVVTKTPDGQQAANPTQVPSQVKDTTSEQVSELKVSGKNTITLKLSSKKKRTAKLKAALVNLSGKIKWKVVKGKKFIKLSKKSGPSVKVTAKKTGNATISISCGGLKVIRKIRVKK